MEGTFVMVSVELERIAALYLPDSGQLTGRWNYYYAKSKLGTDPVYAAMAEALHGTHFPILDLGCGLGIWSFYLRACGYTAPILGLDFDARKITAAQAAAQRAGQTLEFAVADVSQGLPAHAGHVTILDILQYFPAPIRSELLHAAAQRVAPGAKLLIRSGVRDHSWRFRLTHLADRFARMIRWMKSPPIDYCTQAGLLEILHAEGLVGGARPLWGNTPFNNYLFVLERPWA